jgi:uncharacterized protein YndB with AHSA1/START domain
MITVTALVPASIQSVWEKWTSPSHIIHWNFASDDWHCPAAQNDLRQGGAFSFTMASKDGSMSFDLQGTYDEVVPHSLIRYTMSDGRAVNIRFEDTSNGVMISESFDPENMHPEEMQRAGWQAILDNFKAYASTD